MNVYKDLIEAKGFMITVLFFFKNNCGVVIHCMDVDIRTIWRMCCIVLTSSRGNYAIRDQEKYVAAAQHMYEQNADCVLMNLS